MRFHSISIVSALVLSLAGGPLRQAKAGGGGPGCVGWVCGKTYYPDEEYAYQSSLRTAIGQRAFEMFPNFYRFGYALWGGVGSVLGHPMAQRGLEALEQASYGTPLGADEVAFRALRNLPRVVGGLDEGAGVIGAIGAVAGRGRFAGATHGIARSVPGSQGLSREFLEELAGPGTIRYKNRFLEKDISNAEYSVFRDLSKTPLRLEELFNSGGGLNLSRLQGEIPFLNPENFSLLFAVNSRGEIRVWVEGARYVQHSSLFGPASRVVSAGRMEVVGGKITYIDRQSGHFTPYEGAASLAARIVEEMGLPRTSNFIVEEAIGAVR